MCYIEQVAKQLNEGKAPADVEVSLNIHKDIFACLFSIHNIISLSCHEQVSLSGLRFERYFSHHRAR